MSGDRPEYRPMRYGRQLDPPPPSRLGDACTRTHRNVRALGQFAVHRVLQVTRFGYITVCGERLFKDGAVRTSGEVACHRGCARKHERPATVDIPRGPNDSGDRQNNTRPDGTGNTVRDTAESDQPQTVNIDGVTPDDSRTAEQAGTAGPAPPGAQRPGAARRR